MSASFDERVIVVGRVNHRRKFRSEAEIENWLLKEERFEKMMERIYGKMPVRKWKQFEVGRKNCGAPWGSVDLAASDREGRLYFFEVKNVGSPVSTLGAFTQLKYYEEAERQRGNNDIRLCVITSYLDDVVVGLGKKYFPEIEIVLVDGESARSADLVE